MELGTIKWFDSKKGFGFIKGQEEGHDIFVHYSSIEGEGFRSLKNGESVEYELVQSEKGLQAHHVRPTRPSAPGKPATTGAPQCQPADKAAVGGRASLDH